MEEIQTLKAQIAKLVENQGKIVKKIQELDENYKQLDFLIKAGAVLDEGVRKRLGGLETALLGARILNKEGLELHQSFGVTNEKQNAYDNVHAETGKETTQAGQQLPGEPIQDNDKT